MASTSSQVIHNQPFSTVHVDLLRAGLHVAQSVERLTAEREVGGSIPARGGHLGIFWVGMCRPGLQIGTPFWKKFPLKLIPRSRNGPIFYTPF